MIAKSSLKSASSLKRACWWTPVACALVALVVLPRVGPSMRAQDAATTIAVDVKVVTLPVTVRDKHGKIVRDLTKDDFTLQEDGRPQTIRYFSQESNLPLTLGLLVDTSRSQTNVLDAERNASRSFLDQMLVQEKDKAFLIHFDREVELLQDLTSSREKLQVALELLKTPSDRGSSNDPRSNDPNDSDSRSGSGSGSHHGGGTELYDAVFLASNELMKKQQGRKALIILSDGVDRGSKTYLESAIESAQRADTVVYSIYFADSHHEDRNEGQRRGGGMGRGGGGWPGGGGGGWPGGGGGYPGGGGGRGGPGGGQRHPEEARTDGKKILERISRETGGRFFEVSKKESVGEIYSSIVEELRTQYSMGYTPDKDSAASGYHHVTLAVKRKDLTVQTREGYYADR
jgi:VWFA-related protein